MSRRDNDGHIVAVATPTPAQRKASRSHIAWTDNDQKTAGKSFDSQGRRACEFTVERDGETVTAIHAGDVLFVNREMA